MLTLLACLLVSTGCVAVSAKNNRFGSARQAVVLGGSIYIVDTRTGAVWPAKAPFLAEPPADDKD
jgi:hypothetical protein